MIAAHGQLHAQLPIREACPACPGATPDAGARGGVEVAQAEFGGGVIALVPGGERADSPELLPIGDGLAEIADAVEEQSGHAHDFRLVFPDRAGVGDVLARVEPLFLVDVLPGRRGEPSRLPGLDGVQRGQRAEPDARHQRHAGQRAQPAPSAASAEGGLFEREDVLVRERSRVGGRGRAGGSHGRRHLNRWPARCKAAAKCGSEGWLPCTAPASVATVKAGARRRPSPARRPLPPRWLRPCRRR